MAQAPKTSQFAKKPKVGPATGSELRKMSNSLIDNVDGEVEAIDEDIKNFRQDILEILDEIDASYARKVEAVVKRSAAYAMRGMIPEEPKSDETKEAGDALQAGMDKDTKPEAAE